MKETKLKQTELGPIPEDWDTTTIEDSFNLGNGYTPSKAIPAFWMGGTIPWFRMEDIRTNGRILRDSIQHVTPAAVKSSGLFPANSIMLSTTATIGEHALIIADSLANQQFTFLTRKVNRCDSLDIKYFFYHCFILGDWCRANINEGGLKAVNISDLKQYAVPIPPLEEQERIAQALTSVDNMLSSLDKLIAKKKAIKQGAMQQLLSGKTHLPGYSDPWETLRIGDHFELLGNNTFSRDNLSIKGEVLDIHYGDILVKFNHYIDVSRCNLPYIDAHARSVAQIPLQNGDIIMADTAEDETVGKTCEIIGISNQKVEPGLHTITMRPKLTFAPKFLGYYTNSSHFHNQILPLIQGTKVSSISRRAISDLTVECPSPDEQRAIATVLSSMDADIEAIEAKRKKYEAIKQGMMQQLLTGKIRLIES